ncbi:MAG: type II toxin-antitoxin system RelB/DinJ family antitoxin [Ruminococcaceae bacterium]|nr:type II toxin-antitoxin system RelB/DinJ family antitoxin [Oscillospiraceae bacterium]
MGNLNIRMDDQLKQDARSVCERLGIDMSTAANLFFRQMVREQDMPFVITLKPNKTTMEVLDDVAAGKNLSRKFSSVEELMEDLNA